MSKTAVQIVNEDDQVIGHKQRSDIDDEHDIYRSSSLWLENSLGDVLIAQRKLTKSKDPGLWGPAVSGTIDEGETYESNIIKEAEEEIGLAGIKPVFVHKFFQKTPRKQFAAVFSAHSDVPAKDIRIQEDEVEQVRWVSKSKLQTDFTNNPSKYVPSMHKFLELFIENN